MLTAGLITTGMLRGFTMRQSVTACWACVAALAFAVAPARADLVQISTTFPGALNPNTQLVITQPNVTAAGVTFDLQLTVQASAKIQKYTGTPNGIGVNSDGNGFLTNGEWLKFSIEVLNADGDLNFDGFTQVTIDGPHPSLTEHPMIAAFGSGATEESSPEFWHEVGPGARAVDLTFATPEEFYAVSPVSTGFPLDNAFVVSSITASFSAGLASVPEPGAFLFGGLVAGVVGGIAARRRPRPALHA